MWLQSVKFILNVSLFGSEWQRPSIIQSTQKNAFKWSTECLAWIDLEKVCFCSKEVTFKMHHKLELLTSVFGWSHINAIHCTFSSCFIVNTFQKGSIVKKKYPYIVCVHSAQCSKGKHNKQGLNWIWNCWNIFEMFRALGGMVNLFFFFDSRSNGFSITFVQTTPSHFVAWPPTAKYNDRWNGFGQKWITVFKY